MRRTWLLGRISAYLNFQRRRLEEILSLDDEALIELCAARGYPDLDRDYHEFSRSRADAMRERAEAAGLELVCGCDKAYPASLQQLWTPPAVLHVAGGFARFLELASLDPVALVGSRRANAYGRGVAQTLGRGVSASGVCVVSGMAGGVDAAAHHGALAGGGLTVAVLPGCASEPYPKSQAHLHRQLLETGTVVSEFGPGMEIRDWTFIARNRIIAALSRLTVVVQAESRSGALSTARFADRLGIRLGAVPGAVTVRQSAGPNQLLAEGAVLIRDAQDVLDAVFGVGVREAAPSAKVNRWRLAPRQLALLDAIASGADTLSALARTGDGGGDMLIRLAELELAGYLQRVSGGRYVVTMT